MTRLPTDKHKVEDHLPLELTESDLERATGGGSGGGQARLCTICLSKSMWMSHPQKFF